jgi:pectinesterase
MRTISRMKKNAKKFFLFSILLLVGSLIHTDSLAQEKRIIVKVVNPSDLDRPNEMIILKWNDLQQGMQIYSFDKIIVYDSQTNDTLTFQRMDEDQNSIPEELIFYSHVKARETKWFVLQIGNQEAQAPQILTDVRFIPPREDLAWENDRVAFRIYGPALAKEIGSGIDVWTKRVRYPIIEKWYKGDEALDTVRISYHEDHGEGADFFSVGRTLGAGSCALKQNDSLCLQSVFSTYKILATGPIRTSFEVTYKPMNVGGKNISEKKKITLDAGSNLNKVEVTYTCGSSKGKVPFAAGLVKRQGVATYSDKENRWISLWGLTNEKEENGSLGTGVVMTKEIFKGIQEDSVHALLLGTAELGIPFTYYTGAGWTRSGDFISAYDWNKYLKEFAQRLRSPLEITIIKK